MLLNIYFKSFNFLRGITDFFLRFLNYNLVKDKFLIALLDGQQNVMPMNHFYCSNSLDQNIP